MKNTEIHNMSDKELAKAIAEKREAGRRFRFDVAGSKVKNVREGRDARKDVARMMTEAAARRTR